MKNTIQKTLLGGIASLILGGGLAFGEDTKTEKLEEPKGGILSEEIKAQVLEQLKGLGLGKDIQEQLEKALKPAEAEEPKITTKTFVIGPDGKMKEVDPEEGPALELEALIDGANQKEMSKLLEQHVGAIAGKMVVVDEEGNIVEKELQPGQDLNDLIQGALEGTVLGEIDLSEMMGKARVLGVGPAILGKEVENTELKDLKTEIKEVREEMKAQRKLLEEILKKLG